MILPNGFISWIGSSIPAGETNDMGLWNKQVNEISEILDERDLGIADGGFPYQRTEHPKLLKPHKKPYKHELPFWKKFENSLFSLERGSVERVFGILKHKFRLLQDTVKHRQEIFEKLIRVF